MSRPRQPALPGDLVVFLGPSLPAAEALALAPCRVLPPARAGDVFAVLPDRPLAIALVDGVFEAVPSVWHHELLAAQAAGVQVFGGASMGALRAVELAPHGVVGVGRIFGWYRDGALDDDGEVALLHAGPEHAWRPFTVPLVDVRAAVAWAAAGGKATVREAREVLRAASGCFYQERTWRAVLAATRLPAAARARLLALLPGAPSQKAADARATITAAAAFVAARRAGAPPPPAPALPPASSHARRLRLDASTTRLADGRALRSGDVLAALEARPDAGRIAAQGLRRALLAALARALGLSVPPEASRAAAGAWLDRLGVPLSRREAHLAASGLDAAAAAALGEDLALEAALLEAAAQVLPDGPAWREGLALGARLTGAWPAEAAAFSARRPGGSPRAGGRGRRASSAAAPSRRGRRRAPPR